MSDSDNKVQIIPLATGILVVILIGYIISLLVPSEYLILIFVVLAIVAGIIAYFSIKNPEFRARASTFLGELIEGISKIGANLLKNMEERQRKENKSRLPISKELKNKVYDIAAGKCQEGGKKGNLIIHHIDGDPSNNRITNLVLLCGNHHDDADKGVIPKWRLKSIRERQATPDHTSYVK